MTIAFSQACENNKQPIVTHLNRLLSGSKQVLEIGSGTGQHAEFFSQQLPHLIWQCSDLPVNHAAINARIDQTRNQHNNLKRPISLDLNHPWPLKQNEQGIDVIYTANTLHIVSWPLVKNFITEAGHRLLTDGLLCIYGPFNYQGKYTSASNANFDLWLKERDIDSGIRDFEAIELLAIAAGFRLIEDNEMPANNRLLVFKKAML